MNTPLRLNQPGKGAALLTLSAFLFALMGVVIHTASASVHNISIVFFRNLITLLLFVPFIAMRGIQPLRTQRLAAHFWRSTFGLGSMYCFFYAIAHMPLTDAMLFTYAAPVFSPIIAWYWLKEPFNTRIVLSAILGLLGVLVVSKPSHTLWEAQTFIGIATSILSACVFVSIRQMSDTEPAYRIVFYFAFFSTVLSVIPMFWGWQALTPKELGLLVLIGVIASVSQMVMSQAYSLAAPGVIGPFAYLAIVFSGIFAWLLWREVPDLAFVLGALIILFASFLTIVRSCAR